MRENPHFDFWYAVNNTDVISVPERRLETFGTTLVNYHLVSQLMDSVDKVRVREGKLKALRPEIVTPESIENMLLEGFGSDARDYADWLRHHAPDMQILQYGFKVQKEEINNYILSDSIEEVVDRVKAEVEKDDPLGAVLVGVEEPWEVCLLKLMVELVQNSASANIQEIHQRQRDRKSQLHTQIEQAFLSAARDASRIPELAALLKKHRLFERYEDRFFSIVRGSR